MEKSESSINVCLKNYAKIENRGFQTFSEPLKRNKDNLFLDLIMTFDDKWFLYDSQPRLGQWQYCDQAPQHFSKPVIPLKKVVVTVSWSVAGVINSSFLNLGKASTVER